MFAIIADAMILCSKERAPEIVYRNSVIPAFEKTFEQVREFCIFIHCVTVESIQDFEPFEELLKPGGLL